MRAPLWNAVLLLVVPTVAHAQLLQVTVPPNLVVPNYSRVTVGQEEGLEGGAFIARTNNALANWYNPAGLVQVETAQINASATAYEQTNIRLKGLTAGATGSKLASIGSFFGGVVGKPVLDGDNLRLGFSITTPIQWRPGTITGTSQFVSGAKDNDFGITSEVELSRLIPAVAAGFRVGKSVRLGAGLGIAITNLSQRQSVTLRQVSVDSVLTVARSSTTEGSSWEGVLSGGAQWDVGSRVTVGVRAASPGLHILGSSKVSYEAGQFSADSYQDVVFRDEKADFEYRIPVEAGVGVGFKLSRGELEADVTYHGASSTYALFESGATGLSTALVGGVPTTVTTTMTPREDSWQSVVNVAVGGNYRLNEHVRLHAGFYTDASPVEDPESSFFRKVDLTGWTGGASWQGTRLSGSLGLGFSSGSSEALKIVDPATGVAAETKLEVRSMRAAYAISFVF